MAQRILATAGTSAISTGSQAEFSLHTKHFRRNTRPVLSVGGLGTGETASLWKKIGSGWGAVADSSGTQVEFTPSAPAYEVNGPGVYGFTKTGTTSAITIYIDDGI